MSILDPISLEDKVRLLIAHWENDLWDMHHPPYCVKDLIEPQEVYTLQDQLRALEELLKE